MKIRIKDICTFCGLCVDIRPEVFGMGWNMVQITVDKVPPRFEESVQQATDECPMEAVIVE